MIKKGIGGSNTKTGLYYENSSSLEKWISLHENYEILEIPSYKKGTAFDVIFENEHVAKILKKDSLIKFLSKEHNIVVKDILSSVLKPDNSIFVFTNNTLFIIEIKFQNTSGSTDEKLQTCDFKIKQWDKIASRINSKVKYYYILNDWFKNKRYNDVLNYIKSIERCDYFFNFIPLKELGLISTNLKNM